jgi:hypothetical protein
MKRGQELVLLSGRCLDSFLFYKILFEVNILYEMLTKGLHKCIMLYCSHNIIIYDGNLLLVKKLKFLNFPVGKVFS